MNSHRQIILVCFLLLLASCSRLQPSVPPIEADPTEPPANAAVSWQENVLPQPTATLPSTPTLCATAIPLPTATPTWTTTPTRTAAPTTSPTPLPNRRFTPYTVVLHRPSLEFDSIAFLGGLIDLLRQEKMQVVTYRTLSSYPDLTATKPGQLFIITIDDIYLRYPIAPEVVQMIAMLKSAGYPAVLSVITEGDYAYPETVDILNELTDLGWEIASHTDAHINLLELQKLTPKNIFPEVRTSLDKLEAALGLRPITLVLPFGQMIEGDEQIRRTKVKWVVGINGGEVFDITSSYYFVGRESPAGTPDETFRSMQMRFGR